MEIQAATRGQPTHTVTASSPNRHSPETNAGDFLEAMRAGHLSLLSLVLPPSGETALDFSGWCFAGVTSGCGYLWQGSQPRALDTGQLLVARLTRPLLLRASQIGEFRLCYFRLCPDLLNGFFTIHEENILLGQGVHQEGRAMIYDAAHPAARLLAELASSADEGNRLALRARMLTLVAAALERDLEQAPPASDRRADASARFRELMTGLPAAEIQNFSVRELAERCRCSERHFTRLFREHFGFSVRAKQTEMRLQRAAQMLQDSDEKILYVAIESGFRHLGLFNALFKKRFGMTPTEWRQRSAREVRKRRPVRLPGN